MWIRLFIMLVGVVFFINGCNSLFSRYLGTHRLHEFAIGDLKSGGVGAADFVTVTGGVATGDFAVGPLKNKKDRAVVLFPIVSEADLAELQAGKPVKPRIIAWEKRPVGEDPSKGYTGPSGAFPIKGLVRKPLKRQNKAADLPAAKYTAPEKAVYVEINKEPIAWYWNLAMMLGAAMVLYFAGRKLFLAGQNQKS